MLLSVELPIGDISAVLPKTTLDGLFIKAFSYEGPALSLHDFIGVIIILYVYFNFLFVVFS